MALWRAREGTVAYRRGEPRTGMERNGKAEESGPGRHCEGLEWNEEAGMINDDEGNGIWFDCPHCGAGHYMPLPITLPTRCEECGKQSPDREEMKALAENLRKQLERFKH